MTPGDEGHASDGAKPDHQTDDSDGEQHPPGVGSAPARRTLHSGLALVDVRAVPLGPSSRRVAFTPAEAGLLLIELQDSGTDTNHALNVATSSLGAVEAGRITGVEVQAGKRVVFDIELDAPFEGTLRVVANAI